MESWSLVGTSISPGLAVGPVHVVHAGPSDVPTWNVGREEVPGEIGRLAEAVTLAQEKLADRQRLVASSAGEKDAEIFAVHRMLLQDPSVLSGVEASISEQRINAEAAVKLLIDRLHQTMSGLAGDSVRSYAADVSDPWRFVLDILLQRDREQVLHGDAPVILAAAELTPAVMSYVDRPRLLGVIAETGGRFSHGAVLARSFGVPCVVGLPNLLARLEQGMMLLVDGAQGGVRLRPTEDQQSRFEKRRALVLERNRELAAECTQPAVTPDGVGLEACVNIESLRDLDTFDIAHTDGVGLLRTEFLYMERTQFPSEEEQYRLYRRALEQLDGRPATMRVLDIGADKSLPYFQTPKEDNPALGWRGLRILLKWPDFLRVQLRAMLRASTSGELRILLPMVSSMTEIEEVHKTFDSVRDELERQGYETAPDVPVGAMIEVPSMLFLLDELMPAVDFVSVGTNDLVQYLLAADRDNPWVAGEYDPQHPAVLRALDLVARSAQSANRPASVCGDLAGDPAMSILLLGLGFGSVSLAPQFLPEVKYTVRRTKFESARQWALEALACDSSEGVRRVLQAIRDALE